MEHNMENIKVGDIIIFTIGGWHQKTISDTVTKVPPKQFEAKGYRFWKKDGTMAGDFTHCRIATEKDIADFEEEKHRNNLRIKIRDFFSSYQNIECLTIEEMEKIESIIKKQKQ